MILAFPAIYSSKIDETGKVTGCLLFPYIAVFFMLFLAV